MGFCTSMSMSDFKQKLLAKLIRISSDLTQKQDTARAAAEKTGSVPARKTGSVPARSEPTFDTLSSECESLASFFVHLTTHGVTKNAQIDEQIAKLRRLIKTGDADYIKSAADLLNTIAALVSIAVIKHVFGLDLAPRENLDFLTPVTLQGVKDVLTSAQKKGDAINTEIMASLAAGKVILGVADQVNVAKGYILTLNKFLEQPNTENQIVLLTLHTMAQSINQVLADIFLKM